MTATPIIRPDTCRTCKFREPDADGMARCHGGPPQRVALVTGMTPRGPQVREDVRFPVVLDDWWCGMHRPKLATEVR